MIRLAAAMFATVEIVRPPEPWEHEAERSFVERLGHDLAVFVVDHPDEPGRLVASAAGTISRRLPSPFNPNGLAGYVQWVCTDPEHRRQGHGRAVMTALLDWFTTEQVRAVELHATPAGLCLYRSLGFGDSGPRALRRRS